MRNDESSVNSPCSLVRSRKGDGDGEYFSVLDDTAGRQCLFFCQLGACFSSSRTTPDDDGRRRRRRQNNNNNSAGRRKKEKEPRRTKRNPEEEEGPPFFFFFFLVSVEDFGARGATATTTTAGTACTGAAGHGECSFELFDGHGLHVDVAGARERGVEEPFAAAAAGAAAAGRAEAECGGVLPGYDGIRVYDDDFARGEVLLQDGAHRRQEGRASADDRLMNAALPGAAAPQAVAVYVERHAHVAVRRKKSAVLGA
mmetsp:Transcript_2836/g.8541  ORF Transcript_2836/g.8541 Transcript_2836/m.8541 type:complete len:256 (+) Transcript_2836:126-893(+)